MTAPDGYADRRRDAETLAGLLGLTVGAEVSPAEAHEWLQGEPPPEVPGG